MNPVGISGFDTLRPLLDAANTWAMLVAAALAIVSAFARYRRGNPVERTQLRWFGAAAGLTVSLLIRRSGSEREMPPRSRGLARSSACR